MTCLKFDCHESSINGVKMETVLIILMKVICLKLDCHESISDKKMETVFIILMKVVCLKLDCHESISDVKMEATVIITFAGIRMTGDVAQWLQSRNSNPKTLDSIPWWGGVRDSLSVPPSQLLCRLVCA